MFEAWGRFVCRRKLSILWISGVWLAASVALIARGGVLTSGNIVGIESQEGLGLVERELAQPGASAFTVIVHSAVLSNTDPQFETAVRRALEPLEHDARIAAVRLPFDLPDAMASRLRSRDGHGMLAVVSMRGDFDTAAIGYGEVRSRIETAQRDPRVDLTFTGSLAFRSDLTRGLEADLHRGELVTVPLVTFVLLFVFGNLIASSLPVGVGGLAVFGAIACLHALSRRIDVAQYAINIVTVIGLGVAIDYSLFIVSRFREELARGAPVDDAVVRSVATTGRAVAFSGVAVAIGLSGLLFFRGSYLPSMGLGGVIVVIFSVVYALTFLPALLALLGPAINRGAFPVRLSDRSGFWSLVANAVMRRPLLILVPTLGLMLAIGSPFLKLRMAYADIRMLPTTMEARRGYETLRAQYPSQVETHVLVVARFASGKVLSAPRIDALYDLSRRISSLPSVSRVESVVDLEPSLDRAAYHQLFALPQVMLPEPLRYAMRELVGDHIAILSVTTPYAPGSAQARAIVETIRASRHVADGDILVTGQTALDLDVTAYILAHTPAAVAFVMALTYVVLFLMFRSILLPLKALLMNLLSITGSFGALVWVFQQGHLHSVLGFSPGPIEPALPIILFCAVFGLSMDYEVLLLSRMQEEYERSKDNARAVAEGLEQSGRLITSAAAIMVAVFGAFSLASVVVLKAVGLGMALAVALDATVVRLLIVPSTMRLFGDLNWWSPAILTRWAERAGFTKTVH